MITYNATKICIIVERAIKNQILDCLEECGARGYTFYEGGGKGKHHRHPTDRPTIIPDFTIVKIEAIVKDRLVAERFAELVTQRFFQEHSGIIYLQGAEILRLEKF